jgi:HlyD family secretion protein
VLNLQNADLSPVHASIRRHLIAAIVIFCCLLGGLGVWASTTEFAGAIIAPGSVVVESNSKRVQHPSGGIVGALHVKEGAHVKKGAVVIELDATQTAVNLAIVTNTLNELYVRQLRLETERDNEKEIPVPLDFAAQALEKPELGKLIAAERRMLETRRSSREGQQAQLRERIGQLKQQVKGLEEQISAKSQEQELIQKELKGVRGLYAKNLIPIQRVTALERDAVRLVGDHGALVASLAQTRARITETELQIIQIEQDLRAEIDKELADIRARQAELSERKIAAEDQLRRVLIRAPDAGFVHQLGVHTVGGVVSPGETLMMIVPEGDRLNIEARIPPERIDQVRIGLQAMVRLSAFDQRTTPELSGFVSRVSPDLTTDNRTGASYYVARIEVPKVEQERLGQRLVPGMPAETFIQTGERTVITYFTKSFSDQMQRAFRER